MSSEEAIFITFTVIQGIIFLVGFYLQIRTFLIVRKDRDLTWKLYISYGVVVLIYYPSCIFTQAAATHLSHPLADVTGDWLCHMLSFLKIFGMTIMYSHSFAIGIFKYIFVVHRRGVDQYGKKKVERICFCLILSVQIMMAITAFTNPNFLDVLGHMEYSACIGIDNELKQKAAVHYFYCRFEPLPPNAQFGSFINVMTECYCVFQSILSLFVNCNLPEGYFYYKIFQCIYRYAKLLLLFICALLLSICLYT